MNANQYRRRLLRRACLIFLISIVLGVAAANLIPFPFNYIGLPIVLTGWLWSRAILRFIATTAWPMPEEEDLK